MSKRSNQAILLFQVQREAGRKKGREKQTLPVFLVLKKLRNRLI